MRTENGNPFTTTESGIPVNATDAICLLSGVNFGSVEKVLAAIELIKQHSKEDAEKIVNYTNVPVERVRLADPSHATRAAATRIFCNQLSASLMLSRGKTLQSAYELLKVGDRF